MVGGLRNRRSSDLKPGVEVQGIAELERNMAILANKYGEARAKGAFMGGEIVRTSAIDSIHTVSPGNAVTRTRLGGATYDHTASKEGEAPNTDTGRLVSSIHVEATENYVFVGSTLEYAGHLEFGTRSMGARPWLFPALEGNKKNIEKIIGQKIRETSAKAKV